MAIKDDFEKAQADVKTLKEKPDNTTLLELYALYKQGTEGDAAGRRPGIMDPVGRAKFDAWAAKKGASTNAAVCASASAGSVKSICGKKRGTYKPPSTAKPAFNAASKFRPSCA